MTKWGNFAFWSGGHHVANFHLSIVDDDAIDEQFDQLSALGKRQFIQRCQHTPTKRLDSLGQSCRIDILLGLDVELPQLLPETLLTLGHLLSFALDLLTLDDLRQVQIKQSSLLAFKLRQDIAQHLASGLQGLWQPFAPLSPL